MSKWLFITITVVLVALFGTLTYYGMQALEPHTYAPPTGEAAPSAVVTETKPTTPPPQQSLFLGPPIRTTQPLNSLASANFSEPVQILATEDQLAYFATSTIRELNAEKLPFAPYDAQAFPYGKDMVFVIPRPSALVRTSLWTLNTKTKVVATIAGPAFGLTARWSKNGRYVLVSTVDAAYAPSLSFIDTKTNRATPLRLATMPSKCFILDNAPVMYCGVPKTIPQGIILPDDYLKGKLSTNDRIVKIDFATPKATEVWGGGTDSLDIENPAIIDNNLFFTNRTDDSVWKLAL